MDLGQKYIEDNIFEVEEKFANKIIELSFESQTEIIYDIAKSSSDLPVGFGWTQAVYGVIKEEGIYYLIEYLKEEDEVLLIIDIFFVEVDEYLDAILEGKTI
tara:strand:+ start:358 stop:663 length:306 start_codon:yes stop_codon:yes gene_type:complete